MFSINVFLKFISILIPKKADKIISKNVAKPPIADEIFTLISTSKNRYTKKYGILN
jgi:hypothetical protein